MINPASAGPKATVGRLVDRNDFPILSRTINNHPLVYLDSAATTQKPTAVIDAIANYYRTTNANVHRGLHRLAEEATTAYEASRRTVARFIGTNDDQVIFTRNTTEAINLVAYAYGREQLKPGDEILFTEMEHHSNLVPWLILSKRTGATCRALPIDDSGNLRLDDLGKHLTARTKIVAVTHKSNVLGTLNDIQTIIQRAKEVGAVTVIDGAQAVPHLPVHCNDLGADFYAFSGHKMLGPTGVGVLVGKRDLLCEMEPFLGGGEMIREVTLTHATWNDLPWKFEAGTPNIADVIAFATAIAYLQQIGMETIYRHECELTAYALERLTEMPSITVFGPRSVDQRSGVVSFVDRDVHPHDLSQLLDQKGIAIRAGHHCAQPLMRRLGQVATARASFYIYNEKQDVDALIDGLRYARSYLGFRDEAC